jgi:hypothetical protein
MLQKLVNQFQMADFQTLPKDALTLEAFSGEWDSQTKKLLLSPAPMLSACATQIEVVLSDPGPQLHLLSTMLTS